MFGPWAVLAMPKDREFAMSSQTHDQLSACLEAAAERLGDPGPAIYERLFRDHPEMEEMFVLDTDGGARAHMLYESFECLLDLADDGQRGVLMLQAERNTHEGFGVAPEIFTRFFTIMRDVLREGLGEAWSPDYEMAWSDVLGRAEAVF